MRTWAQFFETVGDDLRYFSLSNLADDALVLAYRLLTGRWWDDDEERWAFEAAHRTRNPLA